tara:strand:+ start:14204 stop:15946 length:1743 start_codon:yes stop_codon:yes gene_type:complete
MCEYEVVGYEPKDSTVYVGASTKVKSSSSASKSSSNNLVFKEHLLGMIGRYHELSGISEKSRLYLYGPTGSGRSSFAMAVCDWFGYEYEVLSFNDFNSSLHAGTENGLIAAIKKCYESDKTAIIKDVPTPDPSSHDTIQKGISENIYNYLHESTSGLEVIFISTTLPNNNYMSDWTNVYFGAPDIHQYREWSLLYFGDSSYADQMVTFPTILPSQFAAAADMGIDPVQAIIKTVLPNDSIPSNSCVRLNTFGDYLNLVQHKLRKLVRDKLEVITRNRGVLLHGTAGSGKTYTVNVLRGGCEEYPGGCMVVNGLKGLEIASIYYNIYQEEAPMVIAFFDEIGSLIQIGDKRQVERDQFLSMLGDNTPMNCIVVGTTNLEIHEIHDACIRAQRLIPIYLGVVTRDEILEHAPLFVQSDGISFQTLIFLKEYNDRMMEARACSDMITYKKLGREAVAMIFDSVNIERKLQWDEVMFRNNLHHIPQSLHATANKLRNAALESVNQPGASVLTCGNEMMPYLVYIFEIVVYDVKHTREAKYYTLQEYKPLYAVAVFDTVQLSTATIAECPSWVSFIRIPWQATTI